MKYCIDYYKSSDMLDSVDELNLKYSGDAPEVVTNLMKFLDKYPNRRVNLVVEAKDFDAFFDAGGGCWQILLSLWKENENYHRFKVRFYDIVRQPMAAGSLDSRVITAAANETGLPVYTGILVSTQETLSYFLSIGFSDIFVSGDLAFNMPEVARAIHNAGAAVRVIPNLAQGEDTTSPILQFYIRPDDVDFYEIYVDIMEIFGENNIPSVIVTAYQEKKWFGQLKEIIYNLGNDNSLDNRTILPIFGRVRFNCRHKCMMGYACHICKTLQSISDELSKDQVILKKADS